MPDIELVVPTNYPLTCQRRRARGAKTLLIKGEFPVSVPSLTPREAPDVIRVRELATQFVFNRKLGPNGILGKGPATQHQADTATIEVARQLLARGRADMVFGREFGRDFLAEELRTGHQKVDAVPIDVDLVFHDGKNEVADLLAAELKDCVFVDGVLHRANMIPRIMFEFRGKEFRLSLEAQTQQHGLGPHEFRRGFAFSCLDESKAMEFGRYLAEHTLGNTTFNANPVSEILFSDADALAANPFPTHYYNARASIRHIFSSLNNAFDVMSAEAIRLLADLRTLMDEIGPGRPELSHEVRDIVQILHDDGFGIPRKNSSSRASILRHSTIALKALELSEIPEIKIDALQSVDDDDLAELVPL